MDDLKVYAQSQRDLEVVLNLVGSFSADVGMDLGLEKCAVIHLIRGRATDGVEDMTLLDGCVVRHLLEEQSYTYLGVHQRGMHQTKQLKGEISKRYTAMVKRIWKTELSARNKIAANNILATPILMHTFGCMKWTCEELQKMDRETRRIMLECKSLHPRASVQRLYLPRHLGGRGLIGVELMYRRSLINIAAKIFNTHDCLLNFVKAHEARGVGAFVFKDSKSASEWLDLPHSLNAKEPDNILKLPLKQLKRELKTAEIKILLTQHKEKPMHGLYFRNMEDLQLSSTLSFSFLRSSGLRSETEGFLVACQDGVFSTLAYRANVLGANIDDRCRACGGHPETLMHLLAACPSYAPNLYLRRHDAALRTLYNFLLTSYKLQQRPIAYNETAPTIASGPDCKIFWNYPFSTLTHIPANKPDLAVLDRDTKKFYIIEFSSPAENNIIRKSQEKKTKYRDLMSSLRVTYPEYKIIFIPLIIGVLGGIHQDFLENLKKVRTCGRSASSLAMQMQKSVVLGSLNILRHHGVADG